MNKTKRKKRVMNLLSKEELSSKEIAERMGIPINLISSIISELKKQGKIYSISPRKYLLGIRKENSENDFLIEKNEWVNLIDCGLKIWYKELYTFSGYDNEEGKYYYENNSVFDIYQGNNIIDSSIILTWTDNKIGIENKYSSECASFKLTLLL